VQVSVMVAASSHNELGDTYQVEDGHQLVLCVAF